MLELKFIRENPEVVRAGALKKKISFDLDALLEELEQQDKNPQLEKALRNLRVVPQMDDY